MRRILLTGSSGYIGEQLVRNLGSRDDVERIVGIDRVPPRAPHDRLVAITQDVAEPVDAVLREHRIDTIVHAAYPVRPARGDEGTHRALLAATVRLAESAARAGVAQFVLMSSATVYGFHGQAGGGARPFTEEAPLCTDAPLAYARYKVLAERAVSERTDLPTIAVMRPSFVVGRGSRNPLFEYLSRPWVVLPDRLAPLQLTHVDDVAAAVGLVIARRAGGTFNLGAAGGVDAREIAARLGARTIRLPAGLLHPINSVAWRLGFFTPGPTAALELLERSWQVESGRIVRELGLRFRYASEDALECMVRERLEARYRSRFGA